MRTALLPTLIVLLAASPAMAQRGPGRSLRPASPRASRLIRQGDAFRARGDRGSALGYYREALEADPSDVRAYVRLGEVYAARGSHADARQMFDAGLARHPDHAPLWIGLVRSLETSGALDECAAALRSMLVRLPDDPEGLRMRARIARLRGAWSEALTSYRRLVADAERIGLSAEERREARGYESALRLLARPLDPVSAPRGCAGSAIRRRLARCD